MDFEQTQPLPDPSRATRHLYRCPCGNEIQIDARDGGQCEQCQRRVPGAVTRFPMSMTMTLADADRPRQPVGSVAEDPSPDELIGKRLGHFEIIELIGRGGMGQVYRALDTSLQRYVAVKVIQGSASSEMDSVGQQHLMHEAVAQARVNHPNIVAIYYVGKEQDTPFLAMELIEGDDVSELVRQGEVPYETLCTLAIKITHALDTAAELGIIHSDIKPQNLLMLSDGNVKLSDFGMARLGDDDRGKALGGTPNYLAPELLKGGAPNVQSDMYALGVTLFELSFGRLPITLAGSSLKDWSQIHQASTVEFPDPWPAHLPEGWKTVLKTLLQKNPEDRFESYGDLGSALRAILPGRIAKPRWLARAIAWFIDMCIVLLMVIPFMLAFQAMSFWLVDDQIRDGNLFLLPSLGLFTLLEYWWRQSIGRELVHVKIVNQFGLVPRHRIMLIRSILRMQLFWLIGIGALLGLVLPVSRVVLPAAGVLLTAVDAIYMLSVGRGISLHDRFMRTQAIIGSDRN